MPLITTALALVVALAACTSARAVVVDVSVSSTTPTTLVATTTVAETVPPATTTTVPETVPATTVASTEAPTTTAAPTTTEAPTTTTTVLPGHVPANALVTPVTPVGWGAKGATVDAVQLRLLGLGFWVPNSHVYDFVTTQAVMAFQKFYGKQFGLKASGAVDAPTAAAMAAVPFKASGSIYAGDLIEVDKTLQLLFVIQHGQTVWTFNVSTGSGHPYVAENKIKGGEVSGDAVTPAGTYKIYRQYTDGWEKGQLGEIYRPKYVAGGVAIHGYPSIPSYPASHGCIRVSIDAMDFFWASGLLPMGETVTIHV